MIQTRLEVSQRKRVGPDWPFYSALGGLSGAYVLLIVALLVANASFTSPGGIAHALAQPGIRYSFGLSLVSCTISAFMAVVIAVPFGYLLSRVPFRGKNLLDVLVDVPIVLPPLVVGLSLLLLFETTAGKAVDGAVGDFFAATGLNDLLAWAGLRPIRGVTFEIPGLILAQFTVACAFAVRTMRVTFDGLSPRSENVALTLGCRRDQAFFRVALPEAWPGVITAFTIAWARSLGEFGPILIFAGTTRMKTEVLPSTIYLEYQTNDLQVASAVSMILVTAALLVLLSTRFWGLKRGWIGSA